MEMEQAEFTVYDRLTEMGLDTEEISDTGTVENLIDAGFTTSQIADGQFNDTDLDLAVCWL